MIIADQGDVVTKALFVRMTAFVLVGLVVLANDSSRRSHHFACLLTTPRNVIADDASCLSGSSQLLLLA